MGKTPQVTPPKIKSQSEPCLNAPINRQSPAERTVLSEKLSPDALVVALQSDYLRGNSDLRKKSRALPS